MNILMVIPARSGSKRLPDKNIKFLGNKPLMCWSMETALEAAVNLKKKGDDVRIIVSTDSKHYQKIANRWWFPLWQPKDAEEPYRLPAPFLRPAELSEDVDTGLVVKHVWEYARDEMDFLADVCVTLQPTSPFRSVDDIIKCITLRNYGAYQTTLTVKPVSEFAGWQFYLGEKSLLKPVMDIDLTKLSGDIAQNQGEPVIPTGSVYVTGNDLIREGGAIYGRHNGGVLVVDPFRNIDIETQEDWDYAAYVYAQKKGVGVWKA